MRYLFGFGEDEDGEIYVLTSQNLGPDPSTTTGEVFRIVGPGDEDEVDDDQYDGFLHAVGRSGGVSVLAEDDRNSEDASEQERLNRGSRTGSRSKPRR